MIKEEKILLGKSGDEDIFIYPKMANRHGMIAGATGTGKTVTLKVMAESFSSIGVPVFLADVKGDIAPMCQAGTDNPNVSERVSSMGLDAAGFDYHAFPVNFWDVYGEKGMPLRTTISEMGPLLLSRVLGLNDTQSDVLTCIFKIADDENLILTDTKDLKAMLNYVSDKSAEYGPKYGNIATVTVNAILRSIVAIESEGADLFFGEPALNVADWLCTDRNGYGMVQILDCQKLILHPRLYSAFLLWLISELFESLPEVGDPEKPRVVFFFDEAHMLFDSAPKALLEKIEQLVKLIRSKGVGIYFITQNPSDIPDGVLAQLGNKVQHALHAYTPKEQKAVKAAAMGFRVNPEFDTYTTLQELGTGKALVSVMGEDGIPTIVKHTKICPPQSSMGTLAESERISNINNSVLYPKYYESVDNESAYELLARLESKPTENAKSEEEAMTLTEKMKKQLEEQEKKKKQPSALAKASKSVAKTASGTIGREIGKTIGSSVGGKFGKTLGGNVGASLGRGLLDTLFKL
ncbi:MAG: DUF853 domain-containing protein [Lachnospiraceae bacterium]|nr:DUF853 domain-containing protein [Lachnospiraceae bacterium]